jgi:hypothetical protein
VPPVGSDIIRVRQLIKYWDEADLYSYGEFPDVLIFQKVYCSPDYQFPKHFENLKILDICDPDWLEGMNVKETVDAVDAVTMPTKHMQKFVQQMTDKPVIVIPDRFDIELMPKKIRSHTQPAKNVVWFGYSHNAETIRPALKLLRELKLNLTIISNDDPLLYRFPDSIEPEQYRYIKYDDDKIYQELPKFDFALLPKGVRPVDPFKSNNKTTKAILSGLPVATDKDSVMDFLEAKKRTDWMKKHYNKTKAEYDVRNSVRQYKELIEQLKKDKDGQRRRGSGHSA